VLDVVLAEVDNPYQPTLATRRISAGATIVTTELASISPAARLRSSGLSSVDTLNLYYAQAFDRVLLAGDRKLRTSAEALQIEVHGSLWLVEQLHAQQIVQPAELIRWLDAWPRLGRRLPAREAVRLRARLTAR